MVLPSCEEEPPRRLSKELIYPESTNKQGEFMMKFFEKKIFYLKWYEMDEMVFGVGYKPSLAVGYFLIPVKWPCRNSIFHSLLHVLFGL